MSGTHLVMPMAGRGSRFSAQGIREPKPLIDLNGMPFFWWAVESARRAFDVERMIFVVLQEHVKDWSIDRRIENFYPGATIISIPDVTSGAAETAALGVRALDEAGPVMVNDCDHAFVTTSAPASAQGPGDDLAGALMTFRSSSPNYAYARFDANGRITGTVEKEVVSPFAVAGCYLFHSAELFHLEYERYVRECPYAELFISGMYDQMLARGAKVAQVELNEHFAFGTPAEYDDVRSRMASRLSGWR